MKHNKLSPLIYSMIFIVWLLFFPNAPYIITDLKHLKHSNTLIWFDTLLILSFSLNGLLFCFASIHNIQSSLNRYFSTKNSNLIIYICLILAAFGIYLGRFLRWNTWDILKRPFIITKDIINRIIHPIAYHEAWEFTFSFGLFLSLIFFIIQEHILIKTTH